MMAVIASVPGTDNTSMRIPTTLCIVFICPIVPQVINVRELLYKRVLRSCNKEGLETLSSQSTSLVDVDSGEGPVVGG